MKSTRYNNPHPAGGPVGERSGLRLPTVQRGRSHCASLARQISGHGPGVSAEAQRTGGRERTAEEDSGAQQAIDLDALKDLVGKAW